MSEEKPESMVSAEVKQFLTAKIDKQIEQALKEGNDSLASEYAHTKKLIKKGCWTVRKANKYLSYMAECMLGKGGSLEETQKAMRECGEKWSQLPEEQRKKLLQTKEQEAYDYL